MSNKYLNLSAGRTIGSNKIERMEIEWPALVEKLSNFHITNETHDQYAALPVIERSKIKDHGYFIGGDFKENERKMSDLKTRELITLDLDFLPDDDLFETELAYDGLEYVIHSTHSHSPATPRYRLVLPLSRAVWPEEYQPIARWVAERLGMDYFDETCFRPTQLMFWPSRSKDGAEVFVHNEGEWVNPDSVLDMYADYTDTSQWPVAKREGAVYVPDRKAGDPADKRGVVGKFCKINDIHEVIRKFELPYVTTEMGHRYRYKGSTGGPGAVVYPSDTIHAAFLYSHHQQDPTCRKLCNAWDLVRIHKFGHLDANTRPDAEPTQLPSHRAMREMVGKMDTAHDMDDVIAEIPQWAGEALTKAEVEENIDLVSRGKYDYELLKKNIVASQFKPVQLARILKDMAKKLEIPVMELKKEIKEEREKHDKLMKARAPHPEETLMCKTLEDCFENGRVARRVGRQWYFYRKGLWRPRSDETVSGIVGKYIGDLYTNDGLSEDVAAYLEANKLSAVTKAITQMVSSNRAMVNEAEADPLLLAKPVQRPVINCGNCEIYFNRDGTFEVRDHDPESFFMSQVQADYNPEATCPGWDDFLELLFGDDEESKEHLEELLGYTLQMSRWLKTWVLFKGRKDTGKTTITMLLNALMGDSVCSKPMREFQGDRVFAESTLIGKLALIDDDYSKGVKLPDGFIKKISEQKDMTADVKYSMPIKFECRAIPFVLSNYWPGTSDTTGAMRDRLQAFEFTRVLTSVDGDYKRQTMLNTELEGILNRLIHAFGRLYRRNGWNPSPNCLEAKRRWENNCNPVAAFVDDRLMITGDFKQDRVKIIEVFECYRDWYKTEYSSQSRFMDGRNSFYQKLEGFLEGRKFERFRVGGRNYYLGMRIRHIGECDDDNDESFLRLLK